MGGLALFSPYGVVGHDNVYSWNQQTSEFQEPSILWETTKYMRIEFLNFFGPKPILKNGIFFWGGPHFFANVWYTLIFL